MLEEGDSWDAEVVGAALEARSDAERAPLVNELLGEIARAIDWGGSFAHRRGSGQRGRAPRGPIFVLASGGVAPADIVPIVAWGGMGVVGCLAIRREAQIVAGRARRAVDQWIERILRAAGPWTLARPSRRSLES